jgi:REP element-mobilizing transposase RayT
MYHVVFGTRDGRPMITAGVRDDLYEVMGGVIEEHGGALEAVGGGPDRLHLLLRLHTEHSVSEAVRLLKHGSARWMNLWRPTAEPFGWRAGYLVFTVGEAQARRIARELRRTQEESENRFYRDDVIAAARHRRLEEDVGFAAV